jgi:hypothetical protein
MSYTCGAKNDGRLLSGEAAALTNPARTALRNLYGQIA